MHPVDAEFVVPFFDHFHLVLKIALTAAYSRERRGGSSTLYGNK